MAYERIGLVRPKRRSNRRLYSDQDLARLECVQDLNHSAGISLHGLAVLAQFVPCWAVRQEVESGRAPSPGQALEAGLDRVLGAFGGEAPGRCRKCGVYQARRGHAKDALDRVSSAQR